MEKFRRKLSKGQSPQKIDEIDGHSALKENIPEACTNPFVETEPNAEETVSNLLTDFKVLVR